MTMDLFVARTMTTRASLLNCGTLELSLSEVMHLPSTCPFELGCLRDFSITGFLLVVSTKLQRLTDIPFCVLASFVQQCPFRQPIEGRSLPIC